MNVPLTPEQNLLLENLVGMGFMYPHCKKAILEGGVETVDPAVDWLVANPFSKEDELKAKVDGLVEMGFDPDLVQVALAHSQGDKETAARWLIKIQHEPPRKGTLEDPSCLQATPASRHSVDEKEVVSPDKHEAIKFGAQLVFRVKSGSSSNYMIAHHGAKDLNADCPNITEESTFVMLKSDNIEDSGYIKSNSTVLIETSDECFVAVEADGQVNSNRKGPPSQLMKWKLHIFGKQENEYVRDQSVIAFESVMHKYLSAEKGGGASAKTKRCRHSSKWKVLLQSQPTPKHVYELHESRTAEELWNILIKNYRLAALRIRQAQYIQYNNKVRERLKELERKKADEEDKVCTICWDNPPDTVLLECGHICVCFDCGPVLKECPVCRGDISRVIKIRR